MEITPYQGSELSVARHPDTVLAEASLVAKSVDRLVRSRADLVQVIGGRKHPKFELLQIVASMFRISARVRETRYISESGLEGWEAIAEAVHVPSGQVVSTAEGMCTTDEPDWAVRPKYEWRGGKREKVGEVPVTSHQRRSMAQTRACSKALRLALGWVLGLAGYEATAAEELPEEDGAEHSQMQIRRRSQRQSDQDGDRISEAQIRKLWTVARISGVPDETVAELLRSRGYQSSREIRRDDYDAVLGLIQAHGTHELREPQAVSDMEAGR